MSQTINPSLVLSARGPSLLPYPEDDISLMPSEEMSRYNPGWLGNPFVGQVTTQKMVRPSPVTSESYLTLDVPPCRPPSDLRHTFSGRSSVLATASVRPSFKQDTDQSQDDSQPASPPSKPVSICPSTYSSRQHIDWYTLDGCLAFNICASPILRLPPSRSFSSLLPEKIHFERPNVTCIHHGCVWLGCSLRSGGDTTWTLCTTLLASTHGRNHVPGTIPCLVIGIP